MASGRAPAIPRPPLARRPRRPANDNDVVPMRLINELFTASRILVPGDRGAGARSPNTSKPAPDHRVYPYLLRNRTIDRPNHVRAADITYLPIGPGTGALRNQYLDGRPPAQDGQCLHRARPAIAQARGYLFEALRRRPGWIAFYNEQHLTRRSATEHRWPSGARRQPSRVSPTERRSFVPRTIFQCQTSY